MVSKLVFVLLFTVSSAWAKDLIHSASLNVFTVSSDSELQTKDEEEILTFKPNVSSSVGLAFETEYIGLAYSFSSKEANSKSYEKSKFRDLRFNFHFKKFDFRLMYQNYRGAVVDQNGKSEFYRDYEVKSINGRFHYYANSDHLNYIRDGRNLIRRMVQNESLSYSQSWFLGLNLDQRRIVLPENLEPEHQAEVNAKGINYDDNFEAFSVGPMVGYDGMTFIDSFFVRGKIGAGPAFQTNGGGTVAQFELALNTGVAVYKNHLFSIGFDIYVMRFKDDDQRISNNNAQFGFGYTYAINN